MDGLFYVDANTGRSKKVHVIMEIDIYIEGGIYTFFISARARLQDLNVSAAVTSEVQLISIIKSEIQGQP